MRGSFVSRCLLFRIRAGCFRRPLCCLLTLGICPRPSSGPRSSPLWAPHVGAARPDAYLLRAGPELVAVTPCLHPERWAWACWLGGWMREGCVLGRWMILELLMTRRWDRSRREMSRYVACSAHHSIEEKIVTKQDKDGGFSWFGWTSNNGTSYLGLLSNDD